MSKIEKESLNWQRLLLPEELLGDVESILSPQACAKKQELCFHNLSHPTTICAETPENPSGVN